MHRFTSRLAGWLLIIVSAVTWAQSTALEERRAEIVAIGRAYADVRWSASEDHAFHGTDPSGVWIDTPDADFDPAGWRDDGEENVGMPYSWGGFTSLEQFRDGLELGLWAGNVPRSEHAGASPRAMGLDCSGFVSRAWNLPMKQSTRSLGALCYELDDYGDLEPGDIANKYDGHVVLVLEFTDETKSELRVLEAARLRVEESVYPVEALRRSGFVPMRYKPLDERWVPMEHSPASFRLGDEPLTFVPDGRAAEPETLGTAHAADARLAWARHRITSYEPAEVHVERMLARRTAEGVELQSALTVGPDGSGDDLMSGLAFDAAPAWTAALLDFASFPEPLQDMQVREGTVELGTIETDGGPLAAQRVTLRYEGSQRTRNALYPAIVEATVLRADSLPLLGILEASLRLDVDWSSNVEGVGGPQSTERTFRLEACGSGAP